MCAIFLAVSAAIKDKSRERYGKQRWRIDEEIAESLRYE